MIPLTQIVIDVANDRNVYGEIEGNPNSKKAVIFSHGFGVRRDNQTIYTDIGNLLKNDYLILRFDYQVIHQDGKSMDVQPYTSQAKTLKHVLGWVRKEYNVKELNIIAQSAGCFIPCILQPKNIKKSLFISVPPEGSDYKSLKYDIEVRSKTKVNLNGLTKLYKSDGSVRYLSMEFWDEYKKMKDPLELYKQYSKLTELHVIRALDDDIIAWGDYDSIKRMKGIEYVELPGDHNLSGRDRIGLLNYVNKVF